MENKNKKDISKEAPVQEQPKQQKISVEQVAHKMQILRIEIANKQTEYNKLQDAWMSVMTRKPEENKDGNNKE